MQVEARRKFLAALALDPSNRAAFDALQSDTREVEFITHTVRAGDTLTAPGPALLRRPLAVAR